MGIYGAVKRALEAVGLLKKEDFDSKLDISLSALRDALKGTNNKDFSTLEADIESILAKLDVALGTRASEATLAEARDKLASIDGKIATEDTLLAIKNALASVGADKLLTIPDNPSNLDITLSAHRDALKPTRSIPEQVLTSQSISAGDKAEFTISDTNGYSAIVVTVKATYDPSASQGVRARWLYSPDGTNFDSEDAAEAEGQYTDLTFVAGETKVETVLIPIFQPYVKVQIVNLDSLYSVVVDAWKTLMR